MVNIQKMLDWKPIKKNGYTIVFQSNCGQPDIVEAANLIFNMLCNAPMSKIIRDSHKVRVPNTYNDGYHIEAVYKPGA